MFSESIKNSFRFRRKPQHAATEHFIESHQFFGDYTFFMITVIFTNIHIPNQLASLVHEQKEPYKTCIVFVFLSRSTEFDLRAWQRSEFQRQLNLSKSFYEGKKVLLQQKFMIGRNERPEVLIRASHEQRINGDIGVLRIKEGYRYLTANTWDSFHQILPMIKKPHCRCEFLVRVDTDFIINYKATVETLLSIPGQSTIFRNIRSKLSYSRSHNKRRWKFLP